MITIPRENPLYSPAAKLGVDPYLTTQSGIRIRYARIKMEDISLRDIAGHLSHINRWVGAIGRFSVAQHSVLLARHALDAGISQFPPELKTGGITHRKREAFAKALLLHDAEEYITNDIPGPLKMFFPLLSEYGDYIRALIWRKYNVHEEWYPHCKVWDRRILFNEAMWGGPGRDGVSPKLGNEGIIPTLDLEIGPSWDAEDAKRYFLEIFTRLA
jgi:hypothetical protein